jgi:hypothetical protein
MSTHEKQQAMNELSSEGVYSSADVMLRVEEIRNRACNS